MSTFEKLPREVRNIVYRHCLIYDGEIIPYPTIDEVEQIQNSGGKPAKRCIGRKDFACNEKRGLQSCGRTKYATHWPSIALLGVCKGIQEEAANILFGMNVWRLSYVKHWANAEKLSVWCTYAHHFRHITTHISMNDAGNMLHLTKKTKALGKSQDGSYTQRRKHNHRFSLHFLIQTFRVKQLVLAQMHPNLKSLVFNVENLYCPSGCCRDRVLCFLCQELGQEGPWYRLEVDEGAERTRSATARTVVLDVEAKRKVDVKVIGLENDSEKEIFMKQWGLEVK